MQIVKQNVARAIPCILIQSADGQTPQTGATDFQTTISYRKEGATSWSSKTAVGNWTEVGKGVYLISWSASDLDTIGRFDFVVEHASAINYYGSMVVSANLIDDVDTAVAAIVAGVWGELQAGYTDAGTFGKYLDAAISSIGGGSAPTAAEIAAAVHNIKVSFNKTTGALEIRMADDTLLTSVTISDTATEVTRE